MMQRLEIHSGPDRHGRRSYSLHWMATYHSGHPAGEHRLAERAQHFYGVPPKGVKRRAATALVILALAAMLALTPIAWAVADPWYLVLYNPRPPYPEQIIGVFVTSADCWEALKAMIPRVPYNWSIKCTQTSNTR